VPQIIVSVQRGELWNMISFPMGEGWGEGTIKKANLAELF
jgi:hypothetical protein